MVTYLGYGLQIRSQLQLPGFRVGRHDGLDAVRVLRRSLSLEDGYKLNDDGLKLAGVADGAMRFRVIDGKEIVVDPVAGADLDYVRAIVSGELMSALLRQRGLITLHASCVARGGEAIGFIGCSGWGKSTLSMHYVEKGYRLICDDVLAIEFTPDGPVAVPGYPQVKLRSDSGARYADDFGELPLAHSVTDKRLVTCADHFQTTPVPLRGLYLLEPRGREANQVVPLDPQAAFVEVLRHTRATKLIKSAEFTRAHMRQVAGLLNVVPLKLLQRHTSLDLLSEVYETVERDRGTETVEHVAAA